MAITVSGGTLQSVARFYTNDGNAYSGTGVGYHLDDTRWPQKQYPDDWGTNTCLAFKTSALGASRVAVSGLSGREENYLGYRVALRANVTGSAASYKTGGTDGVQLDRETGAGEWSVTLSPNTVYYLWLFCESGHSGLYQSERYNYDDGLTVTLSGSYGAPAEPSANNGTFGKEIGVTLAGGSAGAKYTVTVACAGQTETLATKAGGTSYTWTPAVATYAPLLPSANSATARITVDTYYADTKVGMRTKDITVSFAANSLAPKCASGWAGAAPRNEGAAQSFTGWVQGYSKARVTFDAGKITPQYGAAIAGYAVSFGGVTVTQAPYDTGVLPETSATITVSVTDSRGQTTSGTLTVSLLPYARPTLTLLAVFRCDSAGTADEDGAYIACRASPVFSALGGENACTLKASVRALSGSFGQAQTLTAGVTARLGPFSPDTAYEVKLVAEDRLGNTAEALRRLATRRWAMKFRPNGNGVAFGKAAEVDAALELSSGWALILRDASGNAVSLDHDKLTRLLGLLG